MTKNSEHPRGCKCKECEINIWKAIKKLAKEEKYWRKKYSLKDKVRY